MATLLKNQVTGESICINKAEEEPKETLIAEYCKQVIAELEKEKAELEGRRNALEIEWEPVKKLHKQLSIDICKLRDAIDALDEIAEPDDTVF